eukprot:2404989-Amphidinium_carterae.1
MAASSNSWEVFDHGSVAVPLWQKLQRAGFQGSFLPVQCGHKPLPANFWKEAIHFWLGPRAPMVSDSAPPWLGGALRKFQENQATRYPSTCPSHGQLHP